MSCVNFNLITTSDDSKTNYTAIINVNNNVYIYRDVEKAKSWIFIRLFTLEFKTQGKAGHWVSEVQSILCEDTVCLKRVMVVWRSPLQRFTFIEISRRRSHEHDNLSDCLPCYIKGKAKQATELVFSFVRRCGMFAESNRSLKISVTNISEQLSSNCYCLC